MTKASLSLSPIRKPDFFLEVTGNDLGKTLGNVISKSYSTLAKIKPDALLVLGDTNSGLTSIVQKKEKFLYSIMRLAIDRLIKEYRKKQIEK